MPNAGQRFHGSAAARDGSGVLLLGPPGSGKSDLLLRLLARGWSLVADDQVELGADGLADAPGPLAGMVEARGLGLLRGLPHAPAPIRLVAELGRAVERLPAPRARLVAGRALPALALDPFAASAPEKLERALDVLAGRIAMPAGAFAA